ncbi:hypothetical protein ACLOJK_004264 [Asimina triloba]
MYTNFGAPLEHRNPVLHLPQRAQHLATGTISMDGDPLAVITAKIQRSNPRRCPATSFASEPRPNHRSRSAARPKSSSDGRSKTHTPHHQPPSVQPQSNLAPDPATHPGASKSSKSGRYSAASSIRQITNQQPPSSATGRPPPFPLDGLPNQRWRDPARWQKSATGRTAAAFLWPSDEENGPP